MSPKTEPIFSAHMHPPFIPSVSPFTLAEDSSTFCSSLDPCSCHGFSSLQSPSAFSSFFSSDDSSQQIEAFQPLSLDSAELCGCHSRHCCGEAALDITQDSSAGPLLHHADSRKHVCPFHSSLKRIPSRHCEALQTNLGSDCVPEGSSLQKSASAGISVSLLPCPSSLWDNTESSALLPIQDGCNEKEQPAFSEFEPRLLPSSPEPRKYSVSLLTNNSNDDGYTFNRQIDIIQQCESFKTDSQINDAACMDAYTTHSCHKSSCTMPPEVFSSVLTSLSHSCPGHITRHGDVDDRDNFIGHINGSRERRVQLPDNLTSRCSVESKLNCKLEGKKEALQEAHENKKTVYLPCKEEMLLDANAVDGASKENISPHVFERVHKRVGGPKADCNGWMCPKDAKKNFKAKPRQLMLDKWLTRQR